ncbi:MAG: class II aldolase/adducin family protein [Bdellovibrionota bacterium]
MPKIMELLKLNDFCLQQGLFWLQGPGGNTSLKNKDQQTLSIKPSGYRLDKVKSDKDLSQVRLDHFIIGFNTVKTAIDETEKEKIYKEVIGSCNLTPQRRPSMETGFHAVLVKDYVFHIHSLVAILICDLNSEAKNKFKKWYEKNWLKKLGDYAEIEATMPGAELALILQNHSTTPIIFLKNHGSIIQFDDTSLLQEYQLFELAVLKEFFPQAILFRLLTTFPKELLAGPLKFYFPDFVILYPRMKPFLTKLKDGDYQLSEKTITADPDVYENWMATQILYRIKPQLKELPNEIIQKVPHLPTELVRQKIMEDQ